MSDLDGLDDLDDLDGLVDPDGLVGVDGLDDLGGYLDTCFGLPWSTLICLGLLGPFQNTIERLKCLEAISGRMGW